MSTEEKPSSYVRARRPGGPECTINLIELEDVLSGFVPGEAFLLVDSGRIAFRNEDLEEDELESIPDDEEILQLEPLSSPEQFTWMEDFIETVHSIPLQSALRHVLRQKKPFRNFKDALLEYPGERERWFQFEAQQLRAAALEFIESLDWEILEVVDATPVQPAVPAVELAERLPLTDEECDWILRGAWQIATRGGRTQLALLLKGSKNKDLLKHNLQTSPAYGRMSLLTIEEIENRIDQVIRRGELQIEYFGDLPLITLTGDTWERIRPWANQQRCEMAAAADDRELLRIAMEWRHLPRPEQIHIVDAAATLGEEIAARVLNAFHSVAGKEVRAHIDGKFGSFIPKSSVL